MTDKIKLGFEVGTGKQIDIQLSHLIATGITQLAGKTVTLESLIKRSNLKAVVFKTKIGERGFSDGRKVAPFFRQRSDYEFVKSLIEAYSREKLFIEKGTLMELCKGSKDLLEIKNRIDSNLANEKIKGIKREIYIRLQHYLDNLIPQIQYANFSSTLQIEDGINIMDLEKFSEEAQSLIIQSVVAEVLNTEKNTVVVIPEAWKFVPQKYNNPCKRVVESFIRQGATNQNFIWIDSQDMAGVDKIPLKQISTWILGYQAERNEVKHTLDQLPPPKTHRPTVEDIMTLQTGFFYYASRELTTKVYVQPFWLDDETAKNVALGKIAVEKVRKMPSAKEVEPVVDQEHGEAIKLSDETLAYFDRMIGGLQRQINELKTEIHSKPTEKSLDIHQIVDAVVAKVLQRIPTTGGNATFQVSPLEKIKKDFLNETKSKMLTDIEAITVDAKRMLKYLEIKGKGVKTNELLEKCFYLKAGGANYEKMRQFANELSEKGIAEYDNQHQTFYGRLRQRLTSMLGNYDATSDEIENVYNHILNDMLGEKLTI